MIGMVTTRISSKPIAGSSGALLGTSVEYAGGGDDTLRIKGQRTRCALMDNSSTYVIGIYDGGTLQETDLSVGLNGFWTLFDGLSSTMARFGTHLPVLRCAASGNDLIYGLTSSNL